MVNNDIYSQALPKPGETFTAFDIQLLFEHAFNLSRTEFFTKKYEQATDKKKIGKFFRLAKRRANKEPIAYILGKKEFYGESFDVNKNVLIPRPETEFLLEKAIQLISSPVDIMDIGAGSGILSIMLAKLTGSKVAAIEISGGAMRVLRKNIAAHNLKKQVKCYHANLFPSSFKKKKFDMIVSNPPYVPEKEWLELAPGVKDFEPKLALTAGKDGLDIIREIASKSKRFLKPGGFLLMEFGYNQEKKVLSIMNKEGFSNIEIINDYSSIPRVVCGQFLSTPDIS